MKNTKSYIKIYTVALVAFLVIDLFWITLFANHFYRNRLGYILSDSPNLIAALIFYLMFIAGLAYFAVLPGVNSKGFLSGIFKSALYGLITYGTYDLTNLALIQHWPLSVTIMDMIWGVTVSVMVGTISIGFGKRLKTIHGLPF
ncbi:MAG: DUF2177 family protein [Desulfobacter sp.]|nr:DUF2177 family protein [Desulfobacter sp.]